MRNYLRISCIVKPTGLFSFMLVSLLFTGVACPLPCLAQGVNTDVPLKDRLRSGQGNSTDLTSQIDNLLGSQGFGADLMAGIQGFGLDVASAIAWQAADKAVEAAANSSVLAPIATTIMTVYEKLKAERLANAINKVKEIHRDALSRQIKLQYHKYKLNYSQWTAKARKAPGLNNSKTVDEVKNETKALYPNYAHVMWEFDQVNEDSIVNATPEMGYCIFQRASGLSNHKDIDLKMALADKQHLESDGSEVFAMSAYDRIRIRQEARAEAAQRNMMLLQMKQQVRARIDVERRKMMKKDLGKYIKLNSQIH